MIRKSLLTVLVGTGFVACSSTVPASLNDPASGDPASRSGAALDARKLDVASNELSSPSWWRGIFTSKENFSPSGSLVLSFQLPSRQLPPGSSEELACVFPENAFPSGEKTFGSFASNEHKPRFAPLLGYFPPKLSKLPAANEVWLEIDRKESRLKVYQGKQLIQETVVEGTANISSGDYLVQSKQSSPRWYAGDEYFHIRGLAVPEKMAESRFLKGALGPKALFLSDNLAIHSSPIWSEEVGGIKVDRSVLAKIYERSPLGVSVVVR